MRQNRIRKSIGTKKNDDNLLIFGVGGKDNFKNVIDKYVSQVLKNYPEEQHQANKSGVFYIIRYFTTTEVPCHKKVLTNS